MVSPSTPRGSVDAPLQPATFALGCGASFVARSADTMQKHLVSTFHRARGHRGTSFVEILQNCIIYNDGIFDSLTSKKTAADHVVEAVHGEPLIFGAAHGKGLRLNPRTLSLEVVSLAADGGNADDILIHDETNRPLAGLLAALGGPDFPTVVGVIYRAPAATFETAVLDQVADRPSLDSAQRDIHALLTGGATWRVGDEA